MTFSKSKGAEMAVETTTAEAVAPEAHAELAARARKAAEAVVSSRREAWAPSGGSSAGDATYELEFPDGRLLRFGADFDDGAVARLLLIAGWFPETRAERRRARRIRPLVATAERVAAELLASAEAAGPEIFVNAEHTAAELIATAEALSAELVIAAERSNPELHGTAEAAGAELVRTAEAFSAEIYRTAELAGPELIAGAESAGAEMIASIEQASAERAGAERDSAERASAELAGAELAGAERATTGLYRTAEASSAEA